MRDDKLHMFSGVHLRYEIYMCHRTASLLVAEPDGVLNDMLVESYAIHLRTLIEFLYGSSRHADDLSAIHYVKAREPWLRDRGTISEPLRDARERANKQIVHFTKKRFAAGAPETQWRLEVEIPALVAGLFLFLRYADPKKLHPIVSDAVAGLASLIPSQNLPNEER